MNTFTGMKAVTDSSNKVGIKATAASNKVGTIATASSSKFETKIKSTIDNLDKKELTGLTELQKKLARRRQLNGESGGGSNNNIKNDSDTSKTAVNEDDPDFTSPRSDAAFGMMYIGRRSCPEFSRPSPTPSGSSSPTQQRPIPTLAIPSSAKTSTTAAANTINSPSAVNNNNNTAATTQVQKGDEIPPESSHKATTSDTNNSNNNTILSDRSHLPLSDRSNISEISSATNRSQSQSYDWSSAAFAGNNNNTAMAISTLDDTTSSYQYNNNNKDSNSINDKTTIIQATHHQHSFSSTTPALSPIKEDSSVIAGGATSPISASSTAAVIINAAAAFSPNKVVNKNDDALSANLKAKLENTTATTTISDSTAATPVLVIDTTVVSHNTPAYSAVNSVTAKSGSDSTAAEGGVGVNAISPSKFSPVHTTDVILNSLLPSPALQNVDASNTDIDIKVLYIPTEDSEVIVAPSVLSSSTIAQDSNNNANGSLHNSSTPPIPAYIASSSSTTHEATTTATTPLTSSASSNHESTNNKRPTSTSSTTSTSTAAFAYNKEDEEKEVHLNMLQEKATTESLTDTSVVKAENMKLIEKNADLEKKLKYSTHKIAYLENEIEELRATIVSRGGGGTGTSGGTGNRSRAGSAASRTSTGTRVGSSNGVNASGTLPTAGLVVATAAETAHGASASALLSSPTRNSRSPAEHMKLRSERNLLELRSEQRERSSTLQTTSHHTHHTTSHINSDSSAAAVSTTIQTSNKRNSHTPMMDKYLTIGGSSFGFGAAFKAALSSEDSNGHASHPTTTTTAGGAVGSAPTTARTAELGLVAGSGSAINDSKGDNPMRISPTHQPRPGVSHSAEHTTASNSHNHKNAAATNDSTGTSNGPFASLTSASLSLLGGSSSSSGSGMTSPVPLPGVRVPNAAAVSSSQSTNNNSKSPASNNNKRTQPQGLESQLVKLEESLRLKGTGNIDPWFNQPKGYLKKPANFKRPDQDRLSTITGSYGYGGAAGSGTGGMRDSGKKSTMSILSHITQIFHFYHSRWFVLDYNTNILSFYKDNKPGRVEKGNIRMENIIDIYTSQVADAPKYALDLISFDTRFTIVAESQESLVKWAFVLNMARKKNFRKGILRFNSVSGASSSGKGLINNSGNGGGNNSGVHDLPSINNLAHVYENQGDYEQAEIYYKQYLEETRKLYGDDHVDTVNAMSNLASLYQNQSKYDQAKIWNSNCIETCRRAFGTNHVETLQAINKLAYLYEIQGQFENAEPLYVECSEIRKHVFNELVSDRESVYSDSGN